MNAREYVVPSVLRGAMFVPRQSPGRREPARVSPGAFTAAGVPVPAHPAQRNIYQLTGRRGLAWTPLHADRPDLCGEEPDWWGRSASGRDRSR